MIGHLNQLETAVELQDLLVGQPERLVIEAKDLQSIDAVALRALIFALHKLGPDVEVQLDGANPDVLAAFSNADLAVKTVNG